MVAPYRVPTGSSAAVSAQKHTSTRAQPAVATTTAAQYGPASDSTDARDEDDVSSDIHDHVTLLVQDWLQAFNFHATLRCFVDEHRQLGKHLPSPSQWYALVKRLQFHTHDATRGGSTHAFEHESERDTKRFASHVLPAPSALESVVRSALKERLRDSNQQKQQHVPTVLVSKRVMQMRELKFTKARGLSSTASAPALRDPSAVSLEHSRGKLANGSRPKSAAVCTSTPDLVARCFLGSSNSSHALPANHALAHKSDSSEDVCDRAAPVAIESKTRPISASSVQSLSRLSVSKPSSPADAPSSSPQSSPTHQQRKSLKIESAGDPSQRDRQMSRVSIAGLPFILEDKLGQHPSAQGADLDDALDETQPSARPETPALSLEDMTEERLVVQFSSLDRTAIKKLRRVLVKSSACTQEFEKAKRTVDRIQAKTKLRQSRRALAAEQTQLLSSTMDSLNKEPCSLCQYVFLKTNLVMKVSYKSILDLRRSWTAHTAHSRDASSLDCHATASDSSDPLGDASGEHGECTLNRAQQAHMYDEVPVCAFCSQLVLHSSSYRVRHGAVAKRSVSVRVSSLTLSVCDPLSSHRLQRSAQSSQMRSAKPRNGSSNEKLSTRTS